MKTTTNRYKCSHCSIKQTPGEIYAGPAGIKEYEEPQLSIRKPKPEQALVPDVPDVPDEEVSDNPPEKEVTESVVEKVAPMEEIPEMEPVQAVAPSEDPDTSKAPKKKTVKRRTRKRLRF